MPGVPCARAMPPFAPFQSHPAQSTSADIAPPPTIVPNPIVKPCPPGARRLPFALTRGELTDALCVASRFRQSPSGHKGQ